MDNTHPDAHFMDNDRLYLKGPEAVEYQLDIAGIGARSHAFIIDWHIRLLLALSWFLAVVLLLNIWEELDSIIWSGSSQTLPMILIVPTAIIYFAYHPVLEIVMAGRTPGKRIAGVRIVTLQGLTPSVGALLLRNIFRLLDSLPGLYALGLTTCALTKHRVRIGDLASGLLLVYDHEVNIKQMDKVTGLALHSSLNQNDQALLLDLLARWQKLTAKDRIRLAEKFLAHIGEPVEVNIDSQVLRSTELHRQLERLTEIKGSN